MVFNKRVVACALAASLFPACSILQHKHSDSIGVEVTKAFIRAPLTLVTFGLDGWYIFDDYDARKKRRERHEARERRIAELLPEANKLCSEAHELAIKEGKIKPDDTETLVLSLECGRALIELQFLGYAWAAMSACTTPRECEAMLANPPPANIKTPMGCTFVKILPDGTVDYHCPQ